LFQPGDKFTPEDLGEGAGGKQKAGLGRLPPAWLFQRPQRSSGAIAGQGHHLPYTVIALILMGVWCGSALQPPYE